jgi:myo-inositol-1(or 4)-monophosphatase
VRVHRAGLSRVLTVDAKSTPTDVVTEVDREAEQVIVDTILDERPDDAVLGEEATERAGARASGGSSIRSTARRTTSTATRRTAYRSASRSTASCWAGVVHDSARDRVYTGIVGAGAACNGASIRVRDADDLATSLVATGFQPVPARRAWQAEVLARVLPRVRDVRRGGSAAIDLCCVASGQLDAFYEAGLAEWDMAAGTGDRPRRRRRRPLLDRPTRPTPLVVAAGPAHRRALVEVLRQSGALEPSE